MIVSLELDDEALARLGAEAARRGVALDTVVNVLAYQLPMADDSPAPRRLGLIALGASSSGQPARAADAMLDDGFARD